MDIVTRAQVESYIRSIGHDLPATGVSPELISDVSARMARFTGRADWGVSTSRTEYLDGGSSFLLPKYWPISSITSISDDSDHVWETDTIIDATDYWIDQNNLGVIYMETSTIEDRQNIKLVYTAGYATQADIPAAIQRAAMMQIDFETQSRIPGRFATANGQTDKHYYEVDSGLGLLSDAQILLQPYRRQVPFA